MGYEPLRKWYSINWELCFSWLPRVICMKAGVHFRFGHFMQFLPCTDYKELHGKVLSNYMCTFVPYKMMSFSNVLNVREVAITPTSMEAVTRPVKIQTTANNLAHTPTGTLSPYLINSHKHPKINLKTTMIPKVPSTTPLASHCQISVISQVTDELVYS